LAFAGCGPNASEAKAAANDADHRQPPFPVLVITPDNPVHSCQPEFPDINPENEPDRRPPLDQTMHGHKPARRET
jgi:hypothetical protein